MGGGLLKLCENSSCLRQPPFGSGKGKKEVWLSSCCKPTFPKNNKKGNNRTRQRSGRCQRILQLPFGLPSLFAGHLRSNSRSSPGAHWKEVVAEASTAAKAVLAGFGGAAGGGAPSGDGEERLPSVESLRATLQALRAQAVENGGAGGKLFIFGDFLFVCCKQ